MLTEWKRRNLKKMKIILLFDIEIVYIKNIREWAEWKFLRAESGILSADSLHENARCSRTLINWSAIDSSRCVYTRVVKKSVERNINFRSIIAYDNSYLFNLSNKILGRMKIFQFLSCSSSKEIFNLRRAVVTVFQLSHKRCRFSRIY